VIRIDTHRKAIAMIELIFAIVIMGIVLMSAPMMIQTAVKSSVVAFQQESIAITATHANALMSYAWDEVNTESQGGVQRDRILTTASTNAELSSRNASFAIGRERRIDPAAASSSADFGVSKDRNLNGQFEAATDKDDVDDFDGDDTTLTLLEAANTENGNYMDQDITLSTAVAYGGDDPSSTYAACNSAGGCAFSQPFAQAANGATTSIKRLTVQLTSNDTDSNIVMKLFMCNIGAAQPATQGGY